MTTMTEAGLKLQVLTHIGDPSHLSLDTVAAFGERLSKVAASLGLDVKSKNFGDALELIGNAIDALEKVTVKQAPGSNAAALRDHIKEQTAALAKLESLQQLLTQSAETVTKTESVLDQFMFKRREDGAVEFLVPKGMSVIQAFEILNTEATRLGINPAVYAADFDWFTQNTSAGTVDNEKDTTVILIPLAKGSLGKDRDYMKKNFTLIDEGHIALANALEWVLSKGKVDSFEGNWVRGKVLGCALGRSAYGVNFYGHGDIAGVYVGCSSGPNKKS